MVLSYRTLNSQKAGVFIVETSTLELVLQLLLVIDKFIKMQSTLPVDCIMS